MHIVKPIELVFESEPRENADAFRLPEPTLFLLPEQFDQIRRALLDASLGGGIEPLALANASELKATKYHLEDMRQLALRRRDD